MKNLSLDQKTALLNTYLNTYKDSYKDYEIKMIKNNFCKSFEDYETQIYYAMDMLEDYENPYVHFADLIEQLFGVNINILEIGGGVYPALSYELSKRQSKGSVSVYDPLLSNNLDVKNINLYKKMFTGNEDIRKYDLIIGKEPCAATSNIIYAASDFKKSIVLSPCDCYCLLPEYYDINDDPVKQWYEYVEYLLDDHKTYYLDKKSNYNNPIYVKNR